MTTLTAWSQQSPTHGVIAVIVGGLLVLVITQTVATKIMSLPRFRAWAQADRLRGRD